jgi:hypothetical protein
METTLAAQKMLIGGDWRDAAGGRTMEVVNPATEEVVATVASADREDVDAAVEAARLLYREEISRLTDALNRLVPPGSESLRVPDVRFRRSIGEHAGGRCTIEGDPLSAGEYDKYLQRVLPSDEDYRLLEELAGSDGWVEQKNVPTPRAAHG